MIVFGTFYSICSAKHAPSLKLMFVGLSCRGKSTLLNHLKHSGKMKSLPITFRQRLQLDSNFNGKICKPFSNLCMVRNYLCHIP